MIEETIYRFTLTSYDTKLVRRQDSGRLKLRVEVAEWLELNGHTKRIDVSFSAIVVEFSTASAAISR